MPCHAHAPLMPVQMRASAKRKRRNKKSPYLSLKFLGSGPVRIPSATSTLVLLLSCRPTPSHVILRVNRVYLLSGKTTLVTCSRRGDMGYSPHIEASSLLSHPPVVRTIGVRGRSGTLRGPAGAGGGGRSEARHGGPSVQTLLCLGD